MQSLGSPKCPLLVGQTKGFSFEIKSPFAPFCSKPANAFNLKIKENNWYYFGVAYKREETAEKTVST